MDRNDLLSTAGETLAYAEDYLDTRIEMLKLDVAEKGAVGGANAIALIIVAIVGLFATGCLTVALALLVATWVDSLILGFLIVGVFYLICCALLYTFRETLLTTPLLRALITQLFKSQAHGPHR